MVVEPYSSITAGPCAAKPAGSEARWYTGERIRFACSAKYTSRCVGSAFVAARLLSQIGRAHV